VRIYQTGHYRAAGKADGSRPVCGIARESRDSPVRPGEHREIRFERAARVDQIRQPTGLGLLCLMHNDQSNPLC
jgi:hypothetical protein